MKQESNNKNHQLVNLVILLNIVNILNLVNNIKFMKKIDHNLNDNKYFLMM